VRELNDGINVGIRVGVGADGEITGRGTEAAAQWWADESDIHVGDTSEIRGGERRCHVAWSVERQVDDKVFRWFVCATEWVMNIMHAAENARNIRFMP